jgi:hypothetical protein
MQKKKKQLIIGLIVLAILAITAGIFIYKNQNKADTQAPVATKKKIQSPVNVIAVAERPYLSLEPSADGRYITLNVLELKKEASQLDYEMEYQTGSMLQGFQGLLSLDKLPKSDRKLFGSQSAGGAITYHEDIKGGNLLAQFSGQEAYAVKSAWRFFDNADKNNTFASQDTKFSIKGDGFARSRYLIVYNSPGYPAKLSQELLSDPYVVSAESSLKSSSANFTVSIRSNSESAQIMGYDGQKWQTMDTSKVEDSYQATGPFMETYILTSK